MHSAESRGVRRRNLGWFAVGIALPVPWLVAEPLGGLGLEAEWTAFVKDKAGS